KQASTSPYTFGNGGHLIQILASSVDDGQLRLAQVFRIIFRVAIRQPYVALHCEEIAEEATGEHDDQPGMSEMDAELATGPPETFRVRGDEIDQQHRANQMASGENGNFKASSFRRPPHEHALEITLLRLVNPEMHLRDRADKNQRHSRRETNNRQLQRRYEINNFAQHGFSESN